MGARIFCRWWSISTLLRELLRTSRQFSQKLVGSWLKFERFLGIRPYGRASLLFQHDLHRFVWVYVQFAHVIQFINLLIFILYLCGSASKDRKDFSTFSGIKRVIWYPDSFHELEFVGSRPDISLMPLLRDNGAWKPHALVNRLIQRTRHDTKPDAPPFLMLSRRLYTSLAPAVYHLRLNVR